MINDERQRKSREMLGLFTQYACTVFPPLKMLSMKQLQIFVVMVVSVLFAVHRLDAKTKLDWNPEKTTVFVVGLLEWEYADIWSSFPECQKDRRDQQLVEYFRDAGVSDERIVYLCDSQATKSAVQQAFRTVLEGTRDGELLIFY